MNDKKIDIQIQLFAGAAALAGQRSITVTLSERSAGTGNRLTLADLRGALAEQNPELESLTQISRFAVGTEFIDDESSISPDATIAMIPPVSGG